MQFEVRYKNSSLACQKSGHGDNVLLLFHGFGQHHKVFEKLAEALDKHYTLYAFDLYFHGNSKWLNEIPLEKDTWREIMVQFLAENKINQFSVLGFSLGGKFALATLELFPERIEQVILLAPDGIKTNFWYSLATYPLLLRRFFKSMILKPGRLHAITSALHALRVVDNGLLRFAESQMDTQEKRERVYYSWVVFRHLKFKMKAIARLLQIHSIRLTLVVGKHDKIITTENMQSLLRYLKDYQLEVLDTGHNGVIAGSISVLSRLASDPVKVS
jgi:pimeloyl-ACP methyl ester carboxylesterase